jgi:phosphatidate cytidylyltransferase
VLRTRLWTAAIALPVVLAAVIFAPAWFFTLFIAVLGIIGLYEVGEMTATLNPSGLPILALLGSVPLFTLLYFNDFGWPLPTIVIAMMLALTAGITVMGNDRAPRGRMLALIGAPYVGVLFPYFALLRNSPRGIALIILMLMLVIASDSGAYFVGRQIGRIKLMPKVSPQKTVEGAIGGLVGSVAAGLILRPMLVPAWSIAATVMFSITIAVLAQLGDLSGSALKRAAGVKDSGWIFPGHGGLLDRTCSLVFATVFTYYYSQ